MATELTVIAALLLLGVVLVVTILRKGDVSTSFKIPFLASFSLEAKDKGSRPRQRRR